MKILQVQIILQKIEFVHRSSMWLTKPYDTHNAHFLLTTTVGIEVDKVEDF